MEEGERPMMNAYLLDAMKDACVMMDKTTVNDGVGGFNRTWVEGATFDAVIRKDSAPEQVVAQQQGVNEMFTIIVERTVPLEYHDVFKRLSDGAIFRLTSNTKDATAPAMSTARIAKATAERWALT